MSDQDLVLGAIEDAQGILADYIEPTSRRNLDNRLLLLLDRRNVVAGNGLRVVK